MRRWRFSAIAAGTLALLWLLFRTGTKPSRITYPCQQAAFSTASLAFGGTLVAALLAARRFLLRVLLARPGAALAAAGVAAMATGAALILSAPQPAPALSARSDYRARVFHQKGCPVAPGEDRFPGLDSLLETMGGNGLKFYESDTASTTAGPGGIIAKDDVVVIKINFQWDKRGGTNTDLLKGLIHRIVNHPDGFAGEVVVCENSQSVPTDNFDRPENNAEDHAQSPHKVVEHFAGEGHRVGQFIWTSIKGIRVEEYSAGDARDGYVVLPRDPTAMGLPSYAKFATSFGTRISLRYGIWDAAAQSYDRARLKVINLPVLKSHHATYGVTACVKHYMGVVTNNLDTGSHDCISTGILGSVMGITGPPDLNILDCVYVNANPSTGPATTYDGATRADQLVAGKDPVAIDIWAAKNILIPAFIATGHPPPWPSPNPDPDDPNSAFRRYLDASMNRILAAGYEVTNDPSKIDVFPPPAATPVVSGVAKAGSPFRLNVAGSGFQQGCRVEINGTPAPATQFLSSSLVVAKGSGLKAMVPKRVTVQVTVVNPDGAASPAFPYQR